MSAHIPPRDEAVVDENPVAALYPPSLENVQCLLCEEMVPAIEPHLKTSHPTVRIEEYQALYPSAEIQGKAKDGAADEARAIKVTAKEIAEHPGGRDGALIEKTLDLRERAAFRGDVETLIKDGHKPSPQVAAVAYWQTLARRVRMMVEQARSLSKGAIFAGEHIETLTDIEAKITAGIAALEKIRAQRGKETADDPLGVVESELAEAEAFVRSHIGELTSKCPSCQMPLTAPELPHWAFAPTKAENGELIWPVWSAELWRLVKEGHIPIWVMAYVLRTSPEGLRFTARRRNEEWPDIDIDVEEAHLRERLIADDRGVRQALLPVLPETRRQREDTENP